jgi:hypothetical protein
MEVKMKKLILLISVITLSNTSNASVSQEKHNKLVEDYNQLLIDTKQVNNKYLDMVNKYNDLVKKNDFLNKNKNSNFNVAQCNVFLEISNQAYSELDQSGALKNNSNYNHAIRSIKTRIVNIINDFDTFAMRDLFINLNRLGTIEKELNQDLAKSQLGLNYNNRLLECDSHINQLTEIKNNSTLFNTAIAIIKSNKEQIKDLYLKLSSGTKIKISSE